MPGLQAPSQYSVCRPTHGPTPNSLRRIRWRADFLQHNMHICPRIEVLLPGPGAMRYWQSPEVCQARYTPHDKAYEAPRKSLTSLPDVIPLRLLHWTGTIQRRRQGYRALAPTGQTRLPEKDRIDVPLLARR